MLNFLEKYSPYLFKLSSYHTDIYDEFKLGKVDKIWEDILKSLNNFSPKNKQDLCKFLRIYKQKIALLIALADLSEEWNLTKITKNLSIFAQKSLQISLNFLIQNSINNGEIITAKNHGIFILAMGKLGGYELNYSSDIDIIILYNKDKIKYNGRRSIIFFMNIIAQDLVQIMQERNSDGYVFRTDLRLRPDPASTPLAVNINNAINYYETVGQNWERAAMIKARVIAGDKLEGEEFLLKIQPFIWRKYLDFAAISDILSIKRQMHSYRGNEKINIYEYNIKISKGGIREIEFLVQIYQLIWGGKIADIRGANTVNTLNKLLKNNILEKKEVDILINNYEFLRMIEHRLQMINDQQTQTLPNINNMQNFAEFCGYKLEKFINKMLNILTETHFICINSFKNVKPLGGEGKLIFAGVSLDSRTINTLKNMGFLNENKIYNSIKDWHRGNMRCTKTIRSREILTELIPEILISLSKTSNPDIAFNNFNKFLSNLPYGIQIFSLFNSNRELLQLIAEITGNAPALSCVLSNSPYLLDSVITTDFFGGLPNKISLKQELDDRIKDINFIENAIKTIQEFVIEKKFQAGVHLLKFLETPQEIGEFLTNLADISVNIIVNIITEEFVKIYGKINNSKFSIISLGRVGAQEMCINSDIDLIFIYDAQDNLKSDGKKSLNKELYFNRLTQRIMNIITAKGKFGNIYDVDIRLRPYSSDGPLAPSIKLFINYYKNNAWIFEKIAMVKARILYSNDNNFKEIIVNSINNIIIEPIKEDDINAAIKYMRTKIVKNFHSNNILDIKYISGGLIDIDFLIAKIILLESTNNIAILKEYNINKKLDIIINNKQKYKFLVQVKEIRDFYNIILFYLRLCSKETPNTANISDNLKNILIKATKCDNFTEIQNKLLKYQKQINDFLT